jgi:hypothetical protein
MVNIPNHEEAVGSQMKIQNKLKADFLRQSQQSGQKVGCKTTHNTLIYWILNAVNFAKKN